LTYTVNWMPLAVQLLAVAWLAAPDRNAVTRATHEIDSVLEVFPHAAGELLFDTVREYTYAPLTVEYEVDDVNRRVSVLKVWNTADGRPEATGN
jgi:hypothetical protein